MAQLNLFGEDVSCADRPRARARRTDPDSAHAAARLVESRGLASSQRALVLDLVRRYPGKTSAELAARSSDLDRWQIARRLPELAEAGAIIRGEERTCRCCQRRSLTWWLRKE